MDPGVIPRISQRSIEEQNKYLPYNYFGNQYIKQSKRNFLLMVTQGCFNSTPVLTHTIKFCESCHIFRPPRTLHCNVCDSCIRGFDHHCLWLGTCIGERNYIQFQIFVALLNIAVPLALKVSIKALYELTSGDDEIEGKDWGIASAIGLYSLCLAVIEVLVIILFCFHMHILCLNQTTYERIKNHYKKLPFVPNPYRQRAGCLSNLVTRIR